MSSVGLGCVRVDQLPQELRAAFRLGACHDDDVRRRDSHEKLPWDLLLEFLPDLGDEQAAGFGSFPGRQNQNRGSPFVPRSGIHRGTFAFR